MQHYIITYGGVTILYDDVTDTVQAVGADVPQTIDDFPTGLLWSYCSNGDLFKFFGQISKPFAYRVIERNAPSCQPLPPPCDLAFTNAVKVDETVQGANDGIITVAAITRYSSLQFSIDNSTWQSSGTFSNLAPGNYTVHAKDSNGCKATTGISILAGQPAPIFGCTNPEALNYNPNATQDDGSCVFPLDDDILNLYEKEDQFRLVVDNTVYVIEEPVGWDGIKILVKRDKSYHGLDFEFTDGDVQLTFTEVSGRSLLTSEYQTNGNDGNILLQFGFVANGEFYSEFEGYVDFNTYKKKDIGIECSVKRKTFDDTLETRFETPVTLTSVETIDGGSLPTLDPTTLRLHSKDLTVRFLKRTDLLDMGTMYFDNTKNHIYVYPDFSLPDNDDIQERKEPGIGLYQEDPVAGDIPHFEMKAFGTFTFNIDVNLSIDFRIHQRKIAFTVPKIRGYSLDFKLVTRGSINQTHKVATFQGNSSSKWATAVVTGRLEKSIELNKGDKVFLFADLHFDGSGDWKSSEVISCKMNVLNVKIEGKTRTEGTAADFFLIHESVERVLKSISNNQAYLKSDMLGRTDLGYSANGRASMLAISNGYQIRNFEKEKRPVIISMKSILESLNALFGIGMSIEKDIEGSPYVRIENYDYFYRDVEIMTFEEVSEYKEEIDTDIIYNEVEVGYKKYPTDEIAVMDEFNTKHSYITPIVSYKKKLSLLSELIGSGYAIELTRRQQLNSSPTDSWKYDEDNFVVSVVKSEGEARVFLSSFSSNRIQVRGKGYKPNAGTRIQISGSSFNNKIFTVTSVSTPFLSQYTNIYVKEPVTTEGSKAITLREIGGYIPEKNEGFSFVGNIIGEETSYNLKLSPKRMLLNHAQWINSGLAYKKGYDLIKNTFFSLNGDLRTRLTGEEEIIEEKSNVALVEMDGFERIFSPEKITFKAPLTYEQIKLIKRCHENLDKNGRNYGYIRVKDDDGNWKAGYLMSLEYNPVNEMCSFVLRKKYALLDDGFNCSDYSNYSFQTFEAATGLPLEIEQCKFSDFN